MFLRWQSCVRWRKAMRMPTTFYRLSWPASTTWSSRITPTLTSCAINWHSLFAKANSRFISHNSRRCHAAYAPFPPIYKHYLLCPYCYVVLWFCWHCSRLVSWPLFLRIFCCSSSIIKPSPVVLILLKVELYQKTPKFGWAYKKWKNTDVFPWMQNYQISRWSHARWFFCSVWAFVHPPHSHGWSGPAHSICHS